MRSLLLSCVFAFSISSVHSQVVYFNYLDSTSVWKWYSQSVGINYTETYNTVYFDGDTLINGEYFYKQYMLRLDSTLTWQNIWEVDTILYSPSFLRETSDSQFIRISPSGGQPTVQYDFGALDTLNAGNSFPSNVANCSIQEIDTVLFAGQSLRHYHGPEPLEPNSILEGVGVLGGVCAAGIEYYQYIACVEKQGDQLSFGHVSCDLFLEPVRTNHFGNSIVSIDQEKLQFSIYPNPSTYNLNIECQTPLAQVKLIDLAGRVLPTLYAWETSRYDIDVSSLLSGIYLLEAITQDVRRSVQKVVVN